MKGILIFYLMKFRILKSSQWLLRKLLKFSDCHFWTTAQPILENDTPLYRELKYLLYEISHDPPFYFKCLSKMTPSRHLQSFCIKFYVRK